MKPIRDCQRVPPSSYRLQPSRDCEGAVTILANFSRFFKGAVNPAHAVQLT